MTTQTYLLGCPRKLANGYNLRINGLYRGYNPLTNLVPTSGDIEVFQTPNSPQLFGCLNQTKKMEFFTTQRWWLVANHLCLYLATSTKLQDVHHFFRTSLKDKQISVLHPDMITICGSKRANQRRFLEGGPKNDLYIRFVRFEHILEGGNYYLQ